jgi:hypothetical protein
MEERLRQLEAEKSRAERERNAAREDAVKIFKVLGTCTHGYCVRGIPMMILGRTSDCKASWDSGACAPAR